MDPKRESKGLKKKKRVHLQGYTGCSSDYFIREKEHEGNCLRHLTGRDRFLLQVTWKLSGMKLRGSSIRTWGHSVWAVWKLISNGWDVVAAIWPSLGKPFLPLAALLRWYLNGPRNSLRSSLWIRPQHNWYLVPMVPNTKWIQLDLVYWRRNCQRNLVFIIKFY